MAGGPRPSPTRYAFVLRSRNNPINVNFSRSLLLLRLAVGLHAEALDPATGAGQLSCAGRVVCPERLLKFGHEDLVTLGTDVRRPRGGGSLR